MSSLRNGGLGYGALLGLDGLEMVTKKGTTKILHRVQAAFHIQPSNLLEYNNSRSEAAQRTTCKNTVSIIEEGGWQFRPSPEVIGLLSRLFSTSYSHILIALYMYSM